MEPWPPALHLHISERVARAAQHLRRVPLCDNVHEILAVGHEVCKRVRQLVEELALGRRCCGSTGPDPAVDLRAAPFAHRLHILDRGARRSGTICKELCERGFSDAAIPDEANTNPIERDTLLPTPVAEPLLDARKALRGDVHRWRKQRVVAQLEFHPVRQVGTFRWQRLDVVAFET